MTDPDFLAAYFMLSREQSHEIREWEYASYYGYVNNIETILRYCLKSFR